MLKPTSPPNVDGFHQAGLQIGFAMRPLTLYGPPMLTILRGVRDGPGSSARRPVREKRLNLNKCISRCTIRDVITRIIYVM